MKSLSYLLALGLAVLSLRAADPAAVIPLPVITVVKAGHLVAPQSGSVLADQLIIIEGEHIKTIGPAATLLPTLPADARIIDLGNDTVLPGLIDCHTHVTSQPENFYEDIFRKSPIDEAITAHM